MSEAVFFLSNQVEHLCEHLQRALAPQKPFQSSFVVVPNAFIKRQLSLYLAKKHSIVANLKIVQASELFASLIDTYEKRRLSFAELFFGIVSWVENHIERLSDPELKAQHERAQKQRALYCEQLACDFMRWQDFAQKPLWQEPWQEDLWQELFSGGKEPLYEILEKSSVEDLLQKIPSLHIFLPQEFPPLWIDFFRKCAQAFPLSYYLLSPCSLFWGDILTEREGHFLQSLWRKQGAKEEQIHSLREFLLDTNRFLANFSKLGRKFFDNLAIENSFNQYLLSKETLQHPFYQDLLHEEIAQEEQSKSLLTFVQADLLLLRNHERLLEHEEDFLSLQIHECPSKRRELEILKENLKAAFLDAKRKNIELSLEDCIVLCPQPKDYEAYIRMTFPSYEIHDLSLLDESPFLKTFFSVLELRNKRWTPKDLLELFEKGVLSLKTEEQELKMLEHFLEQSKIAWGFDKEEQEKILQKELFIQKPDAVSQLSWKEGFSQLLESYAISSDLYFDYSQAKFLGEVLEFLQSLFQDLEALQRKQSLKDFAKRLEAFLERYFCSSAKDYSTIKKAIDSLKSQTSTTCYELSTLVVFLQRLMEGKKIQKGSFSALKFAKIDSAATWPAKFVYLLGLQEADFPRKEKISAFERLQKKRPFSSFKDLDRYLFLQAILSCRKYFFVSYVKRERQRGLSDQEGVIIHEWLTALDLSYRINGQKPSKACLFAHPQERFDQKYFQDKQQGLINHCESDYLLAKAHYQKKDPQKPFFDTKEIQLSTDPDCISLQELMLSLSNPLELYYRSSLGARLGEIETLEPSESTISPLLEFFLRKEALQEPFENVWQRAQERGLLPEGFFHNLLEKKIRKDLKLWKKNLEKLELSCEAFKPLHLRLDNEIAMDAQAFPALEIGNTKLYGTLFSISPEGLLIWGKSNRKNLLKAYVQWLIVEFLRKKHPDYFETNKAFSLHKGQVFDFSQKPSTLQFFLNFCKLCRKRSNPLKPQDYDLSFKEWKKQEIEESPFGHLFYGKNIQETSLKPWKDFYEQHVFADFFKRFK